MDGAIAAMFALLGATALKTVEMLVRRFRPRSEIQLSERELLSADENRFRAEILLEQRRLREELAHCQTQHTEAVREQLLLNSKLAETDRRLQRITAAAIASGVVLDTEV